MASIIHHKVHNGESQNSNFITEFTEFLMDVTSKHNNILTLGDFNIHIDDLEDADSCLLHDTINAFNLKQQVNIPTHNLGHILDLIITENSDEYEVEKIIPGPYLSDHQFITIQLTECKPKYNNYSPSTGEYQLI